MTEYTGKCFCGQISYTVVGEPLFVQFCHCNKCRETASKSQDARDLEGYSKTAAYLTANFKIDQGIEELEKVPKNNAYLYFCNSCCSQIYGISQEPAQQGGIGLNFNTLILPEPIPDSFKPIRHVYFANRTVTEITDELPKYVDMPIELGGTGKLIGSTPKKKGAF